MGNDGCGFLELDLIRTWQLRRDGGALHVAVRQQRLIAALAVRGPCLRSYLAGLLWPQCPEANALESLRVAVHLVTRQLPGLLVKDGSMLSLGGLVHVDLHRVRALLQDSAALASGGVATILRDLRGAELLPGWYEDWVLLEQGRFHHDLLRALTTMSRDLCSRGLHESASAAAAAALDLEPLDESAVRAMISAELQQGNTASALLAYEKYKVKLREEMRVLPSEGLRDLIGKALGDHGPVVQVVLALPPAGTATPLSGQPFLHET